MTMHTLTVYVEDRPGFLNRVASLFRRSGFNIVSLAVGHSESPGVSLTDPVGYLELAEAWRPYVEAAIEAFGPERCMMESNYPPDGRAAGFVPLWNALKHIVRGASSEEKAALFHRTATRVYRLPAFV